MPTPQALATYGRWKTKAEDLTGFIMEEGKARYKALGLVYQIELADKEIDDGGLTGWTYVVKGKELVPCGFFRIYGNGGVHTWPFMGRSVLE